MRKSDNYSYRDKYRKGNKGKKQRILTKNEAKKIKSKNFTGSNKEKYDIAIMILNRLTN